MKLLVILLATALSFTAAAKELGGEDRSDNGVSTSTVASKSGALDVIEIDFSNQQTVPAFKNRKNVLKMCGADNRDGYPVGFEWDLVKKSNGKLACVKYTYSNR